MVPVPTLQTTGGPVGAFWDLIQTELDKERFEPSDRAVARLLDVSPTTISNWKAGLKALPKESSLRAVAGFVHAPYEDVLIIALSETGHARGTRLASRRGRSWAEQMERDARGQRDHDPSPESPAADPEADVV